MSKVEEVINVRAQAAIDRYNKQLVYMRGWLSGVKFHNALRALEFARSVHKSVRKDGYTPEFAHQIEIACFAVTLLPHLQHPEETLTTIFLHDITEDYDVTHYMLTERFGDIVSKSVQRLDRYVKNLGGRNVLRGDGSRERRDEAEYYSTIAGCPIASIDKGLDRMHNMRYMEGVFTPEKQVRYAMEVEDHILPMLKAARRLHVSQELAYYNIKTVLELQVEAVRAMHGGNVPWRDAK